MSVTARLGSSFRDPSGFTFRHEGAIYRQIASAYAEEFLAFQSSGLLDELVAHNLLVPHEEAEIGIAPEPGAAYVIRPEQLDWISYPYEWGFGQWKDAALCTLDIAKRAFDKGFVLKDASAFNIQFRRGKPILIDTLSFERYVEGEPWIAYRQFCQHFLAPLAMMAYVDPRLGTLFRCHLDGIPLDLASKMLPGRARWNFGVRTHIEFHAKANTGTSDKASKPMSKLSMMALMDSLRRTVESLTWEPTGTEWADYYSSTNYSEKAEGAKRELVKSYLARIPDTAKTCWDLGANDGSFSRLAVDRGLQTVGWDIDRGAVENGYRWMLGENRENYLPLTLDLTNPSPSIGWNLEERDSFFGRGPVNVVLGLALIHHLAIGNNVPFDHLADFFARIGEWCILEFVPKSDSQVQRMLVARKDVFENYGRERFEQAMQAKFEIVAVEQVQDSERLLYLLRRRD